MALPDERFKGPIREIVRDLAAGKYDVLEADGRSGRTSANGLRERVESYGDPLVELPDEAFEYVSDYESETQKGLWKLDVPLYTEEEGQSDLTLVLEASASPDDVKVTIRDLRVL